MITNVINRLFNNLTRLSICHTLGLHPRKAMSVGGHALLLFHSEKESVPTTYHDFLGTPITLAGGTKQNIKGFAIRYTDNSVPIDLRHIVQDTIKDTTATPDLKPITSPATHRW